MNFFDLVIRRSDMVTVGNLFILGDSYSTSECCRDEADQRTSFASHIKDIEKDRG